MAVARASRWAGYPWLAALAVFFAGGAVYALLPVIAPLSIADPSALPLLGIALGIAVGIAVRLPHRLVPPLIAGAGVAVALGAALTPNPVVPSSILGFGVAVEIWLVAYLLRRTGASRLTEPKHVLWLAAIAVGVAIPTALLAAGGVQAFGLAQDEFLHEVRSWATDDVFGLVVVAPTAMLVRRPRRVSRREALEYALVAGLSVLASYVIFFRVQPSNPGLLGWPYLVVLGPAWIAVRRGAAAVAPVATAVFWLAAVATAQDLGPFSAASDSAVDRLVAVEIFGVVLTSGLLALGILRDDRFRQLALVQESSRLLREVVDGSASAVFAKEYRSASVAGRYVLVNRAWELMTGAAGDKAIGRTDEEVFPAGASAAFTDNDRRVLEVGVPILVEEVIDDPSGAPRILSSSKFPLLAADGRVWGVGGISTDITDTVRARERERRQARLLRAVFEMSPTPAVRMVVRGHHDLVVVDANLAMLGLLGLDRDHAVKLDLMSRVHPDDLATAWDIITQSLTASHERRSVRQRELRLSTVDGRTVWVLMSSAAVHEDAVSGATETVAQFEDFTARREAEVALSDQALRDSVTGLPNRRALNERLGTALARLGRTPGTVTVLFCDLDRFKEINDTFGHQVGDLLLVEVAERLRAAMRPDDTVARLGGDEFVILTEGIKDASDAVLTGLRLQDRLGAPWGHGGQTYRPEMSIGVAITDDPAMTVDEVLRRADLAMYEAKDAGRNRVEVYQRSVDDEIQRAVAIQHDLRKAIDSSGLVLHYQPIVRLADEEVIGAEALVRMRTSDGSLLLPGEFVPQAESTGLVVPMGAWVLRRAMSDLRKWRERGHSYLVSVNVSQWQHREEGFAAFVLDQAEFAGINPAWLVVEVTETALIHDPARSSRELAVLSQAGVGIALDDFGTGYSSLSWLTQLPVTSVKIDQSFTAALGFDERKEAIVRALIEVSHDLGLVVVAEGVETAEQAARLVDLDCDRGQGYLFGVPGPIGEGTWA